MLNNVVKKYVSEKLLLDIKRTKIREKKIQEGNEYRKNVKKIGKFRCFWVDDTIPVEMSESEGQKRPFKALDDESSESVSEIDWTWHFFEKNVLVDPVVKEKDDNESAIGKRSN